MLSLLCSTTLRRALRVTTVLNHKALEHATVEGMLTVLRNTWATYDGASDHASFQDALDAPCSGVGPWLTSAPAGAVKVGSVLTGSPAARAGLRPADVIRSVASPSVADAGGTRVATLRRGRVDTKVRAIEVVTGRVAALGGTGRG